MMHLDEHYQAVVIGGGQAGLAIGYHLKQKGYNYIIVEKGEEATGTWREHYDSLQLFSPAEYSELPGMPFPGEDKSRHPTRDEFVNYLRAYRTFFELTVMTQTTVKKVIKNTTAGYGKFKIEMAYTDAEGEEKVLSFFSDTVIVASGSYHAPNIPTFAGQKMFKGDIMHSKEYKNQEVVKGKRVVVVGSGNSAVQIAHDASLSASNVILAHREPVQWVPLVVLGKDVHWWWGISGGRLSPYNPLLVDQSKPFVLDKGMYYNAVKSGQVQESEMFDSLYSNGVQWKDGSKSEVDVIILATGYRCSHDYLEQMKGAVDKNGELIASDGVSDNVLGLFTIGLNRQRTNWSVTIRGATQDAAILINAIQKQIEAH
eukprot:Nk52_evm2s365 gene=Nk52_evmTU2s365